MMNRNTVLEITSKLLAQHHVSTEEGGAMVYPKIDKIIALLKKMRIVLFPDYFAENVEAQPLEALLQSLLEEVHRDLSQEIEAVLYRRQADKDAIRLASDISANLLEQFVNIQQLLYKDARAGVDGDPAASGIDDVILTYPGFFAVFVYRIAHFLYLKEVPFIPRMMTEYAHSVTGIDINPGAKIGEYFFIDHGTGVVIGETAVIGNHVKIYQGVTVGAISTKGGQKLSGKKRHPTIEDNVTIYSGASILGGNTVIGQNSTIGGNVFITKSVPQDTMIKGVYT